MSGVGHNSADDQLRLLVERIERLEEERKAIGDDIKDVFAEGKALGYNIKILREVIRLRKLSPAVRAEQRTIREEYERALGMDLI